MQGSEVQARPQMRISRFGIWPAGARTAWLLAIHPLGRCNVLDFDWLNRSNRSLSVVQS